jgi:hypothetical protein
MTKLGLDPPHHRVGNHERATMAKVFERDTNRGLIPEGESLSREQILANAQEA